MKTVRTAPAIVPAALALSGLLSMAAIAAAGPRVPSARLLDMYAVREGDQYVVHVLASGDISEFLSDRRRHEESYRLTLDVPALSPSSVKFDVATPFSRRFQVWPMQLGKKIYSRIEIELDVEASSVVGLENASHLFVRIHRELPPGVQIAEASREPEANGEMPPAAAPSSTAEEEGPPVPTEAEVNQSAEASVAAIEAPADPADDELYFSLFPAPMRKQQTLFSVAADEPLYPGEAPVGIRLGRFALQPSIDASWIRGDNLLQTSEEPFLDTAFMVRGRVTATLLESTHDLKLAYEGRYRDFQEFVLEDPVTHLFDVGSELELTPNTRARLSNHFVRGAFEANEFDPGGEITTSTNPFYRNYASGTVAFDVSERLGVEASLSYNVVDFLDGSSDFFDYDTRGFGGALLYELSPITSLLGEYVRTTTPEPVERPQAGSVADTFLVGVKGELTPLLRGEIRAGYANQRFEYAPAQKDYSGFVADLSLTRDFGDEAALTARAGRRTNPSAFEENGYYVSNYARLQFISPVARNLRLTVTAAFYRNDYPLPDETGAFRDDDILSSGAGVAYFFTPLTFLSLDYRHDRRQSSIESFSYNSNAVHLMVGFGFLNR